MGAETGATAAPLYRKCRSCEGTRTVWDDPESDCPEEYPCPACSDGYEIVGPDAVVLTDEQAATAADGLDVLIAKYETLADRHARAGRDEQEAWERNNAARYRALVEVLNGNG